jgi:predicted RNA-binding protein YlqC (UPF0109 family)
MKIDLDIGRVLSMEGATDGAIRYVVRVLYEAQHPYF